MAIPILGAVSLITKIVGAVLPGKAKEVIDTTVNEIITTNKDVQEWVTQQNNFILEYEGKAEIGGKTLAILRAIPRLFITIGITIILFKYLWLNIPVPDKLYYLSSGIFAFYFYFRHKEKMNGLKP